MMPHYDRSTIREEPVPGSKTDPVIDADQSQRDDLKHRYSLRRER
jgi:hypothetical protein